VKRERILPKANELLLPSASQGSASAARATVIAAAAGPSGKPLSGLRFVVIGRTSKKKADIGKLIAERGGKMVAAVDDKVAACISTEGAHFIAEL